MEGEPFAMVIAGALRREFGTSAVAVKQVAFLARANERAVKNWFDAKNAPSGENLVSLMRHSDEVLETVLAYPGIPPRWRLAELWTPLAPVLPTRLGLGEISLSFITMLCSFGTPLDLTADSLRVECLFPADEFTDQFLRQA